MTKRHYIMLVLLAMVLTATAGPIGKAEALGMARAIAAEQGKTINGATSPYMAPRKGAAVDLASYYVFNFDGGRGFVIIAGDDAVDARQGVLGMTDSGSFSTDAMPANFRAWLEQCADEVEAVAGGAAAYAPAVHADIAPMLTTTWNQSAPYNDLMPTYSWQGSTVHYYTGCTITAMTQVMRYHRWPQGQTTSIPAYAGAADLPPVTFDWANMKDTYGSVSDTEAEKTAVAQLMYYCAQASKPEYRYDGTGVTLYDAEYALKMYFGYSRGARTLMRSSYSIDEWDRMIYGELQAGRPVVYAGYSTGGGHAFVCDGYRDALYHINWGWGGYCDGYFRLSVLSPAGSGIGGSSTTDGYSMMQQALVGIQRPDGNETAQHALTSLSAETDGTYVAFDYYNISAEPYTFDVGCEMADEAGTRRILWSFEGIGFGSYSGTKPVGDYLSRYNLADGTYRVYPVCRESGRTEWQRCTAPSYYVEARVAGGNIVLTGHPIESMTVTAISLPGNMIATAAQEVLVTVSNSGDEIYGSLYLHVQAPGSARYTMASGTGMAIEAGGEETVSLYFTPATEGTYTLKLTTDEDGNNVIGSTTVDITAAPTAKYSIRLRTPVVVPKGDNTLRAGLVNSGSDTYLRPIVARLYKDNNTGSGYYTWVEDQTVYQPMEAGGMATFTFTFTRLIPGEKYAVELLSYNYFSDASPENKITTKIFTATATGIDTVTTGDDAGTGDDAPCYTLGGRRVQHSAEKGVYIRGDRKIVVTGKDNNIK